jgi:hypothetical protein
MYKIFNTFVDDAFAWLIEMPWKHQLMTLRDDVVFLIFLVQVYLDRVDKTRTNEFGYSYEEDEAKEDEALMAEKEINVVITNSDETTTTSVNEQNGKLKEE